jgi:MFS transporter, DHA1 family, inner membrane transport protein
MWFRILVLAIGTFALGTDAFVISGILPDIAHQLTISVDLAGQLVTVFSLTYALGAPVLATLAGNVARKHLLIGSLLLFAIANVLAAGATSFLVLIVARVFAAIGAALYTPTASAVAVSLAPVEKRGRALSLVVTGMTVSLILGVPLGIVIGSQFGWQMTFVLIAALSALALIGVLTLFPTVDNPPIVRLRTRLALLRKPTVVVTLLVTLACLVGNFTVYTYLGPFLQQVTHLDSVGTSSIFFLFGLVGLLGNAIGAYSIDRWGAVRTLVPCLLVMVLAFLTLSLAATTFLTVAIAIVMWSIAGTTILPAQQHRLIGLSPQGPVVVLSLNSSAIYLGTAGGAALGGLALNFTPLRNLGWIGSGCELIAFIVLCWSIWLIKRSTPQADQPEGERVQENNIEIVEGAGLV